MKIALMVSAIAALPALALAQTQIPAMTVPAVQVDFDSMTLGATTVAAINAAHPGANIASIQAIAPLAAVGSYSVGFALGRALALNPDGSGGLFIVDPGQAFGGGNGYRIDLGTVSTQVGLSIADFTSAQNVDFYSGGVLVGNSTVSGAGGPVVTFYELLSGFDRVDITGTPNYVIPEIWVEGCDPCDVNCDGVGGNFLDIDPFLDLLFGGAVPCSSCAGDADGNGVVDAFDIEFFLACFSGPPPVPGVGPGFRIFFDESGNAGSNAAPHPSSGTLSYGNPVLLAGGGRLYIYGEFQNPDQTILSPNFDITIDGGTITGAWNYNGPGQSFLTLDQRWDAAAPNPVISPGGTSVSFTAANRTHMGLKNDILADNFDVQHDNTRNDGDTLLGYIDVVALGTAASVWLTVGQQGFAIQGGGPTSPILFGYGDASVVAGGVGDHLSGSKQRLVLEPLGDADDRYARLGHAEAFPHGPDELSGDAVENHRRPVEEPVIFGGDLDLGRQLEIRQPLRPAGCRQLTNPGPVAAPEAAGEPPLGRQRGHHEPHLPVTHDDHLFRHGRH